MCDVISAWEQRTRALGYSEAEDASSPDGPWSKDLLQVLWLGDAGGHSEVIAPAFPSL